MQKNKDSAKRFGILFPKKVSKIAFFILVQKLQVYKLKLVVSKFVHFYGMKGVNAEQAKIVEEVTFLEGF